MQPEDQRMVDTRAWLAKAALDLRAAEYAWKFRYPGDPHEPPSEEVDEALASAREAYGAILARLPEEVHP